MKKILFLLMKLWRHKLSDMASYLHQNCRNCFETLQTFLLCHNDQLYTFLQVFNRDLQKYCLFTYFVYHNSYDTNDFIGVSLRIIIKDIASKIIYCETRGNSYHLKNYKFISCAEVWFIKVSKGDSAHKNRKSVTRH